VTVVVLMVAMFEWVEQLLPHDCGLAPNSILYLHTFDMLFKGTSCWGTTCYFLPDVCRCEVSDTCDLNTFLGRTLSIQS